MQRLANAVVVYVTAPSAEVAKGLARQLVTRRLAACVNIVPSVTSVYEWEGKIEEDSECLLMIKTRNDLVADLTSFVEEEHPYDVPEVISVPIEGGSEKYLVWIASETSKVPS